MKKLLYTLLILLAATAAGCIEDGFSTSPSDAPHMSVDTLHMGTVFTEEGTPTYRFTVHNRASKSISISSVTLGGDNPECFRLNVDGFSGREFHDVEIRAKDSIYVFVAATLPANGKNVPVDIRATVDFLANGVEKSVVLDAQGRDAVRLHAVTLDSDTDFPAGRPYIVYDSLVVAPGVTLRVAPGAELYFHDGAHMAVRGSLYAAGTPDSPVHMAGDRTGNVVADISFDIMSRQWTGVFFTSTSRDNVMVQVDMRNTWQGLRIEGTPGDAERPSLSLLNCRLHNSAGLVMEAVHADVAAFGCEFAEGGEGLVRLQGGSHVLNHCTLANYYLFAAISGPALQLAHTSPADDDSSGAPYTRADISNSIIYGLGTDLSHGDLSGTDITLDYCLLKSAGSDDDNFSYCLWDTDPLYRNDREKYIFDYRLGENSPAIGACYVHAVDPRAAVDAYGNERGSEPDLGAYVYVPQQAGTAD